MIAESTAMQSVINTQPTYPANNAPFLINTPVPTTENADTAVNQIQPTTACIVSNNSSQQTASYSQLPTSINELAKPNTLVQSKIVNVEKQVNIETKSTIANDQVSSQSRDFLVRLEFDRFVNVIFSYRRGQRNLLPKS